MTDLLTAAQVAVLADITPGHVARWTRRHGIHPTRTPGGRYRYPGVDVHAVLHQPPAVPPLRLARFIANPLNH